MATLSARLYAWAAKKIWQNKHSDLTCGKGKNSQSANVYYDGDRPVRTSVLGSRYVGTSASNGGWGAACNRDWWAIVGNKVKVVFTENWGNAAMFIIKDAPIVEFVTKSAYDAKVGDVLISRVSLKFLRTRADVMSAAVHELRHVRQMYNLFTMYSIKSVMLSCSTITKRVAEIDALMIENQWLINATGISGTDVDEAQASYNDRQPFTADELWDHDLLYWYKNRAGVTFDEPFYLCQ